MCTDCGCTTATHPVFLKPHSHTPLLRLTLPPPAPEVRRISVEASIFEKNQRKAVQNRTWFAEQKLLVWNVMSSPGAGKTTLLCRVLPDLANEHPLAVIVGDQETSIDAERLQKAGLQSIQINTHAACHLDASRIAEAVHSLPIDQLDLLVIENVGNLVCPAVFDLGETKKIALLSTAEGEEKPLKYPVLFHDADLVVITKSDLIPHLDYAVDVVIQNVRSQNPTAPIVFCSVRTGEGLETLIEHLQSFLAIPENSLVFGDPRTAAVPAR